MASVAVLGMGDDEVDRVVTRLLTEPASAALHPRCCGAAIWMAWECGEGARGPVAPSGAATWSTHPGGDARVAVAPVVGVAGGLRLSEGLTMGSLISTP